MVESFEIQIYDIKIWLAWVSSPIPSALITHFDWPRMRLRSEREFEEINIRVKNELSDFAAIMICLNSWNDGHGRGDSPLGMPDRTLNYRNLIENELAEAAARFTNLHETYITDFLEKFSHASFPEIFEKRESLQRLYRLWTNPSSKVAQYYAVHMEYIAPYFIWQWLRWQTSNYFTPPQKRSQKVARQTSGFIYVIETNQGHKIGKTAEPGKRKKSQGTIMPYDHKYGIEEEVPNYSSVEKELHSRFATKRFKGEWFHLTEADIQEIADTLAAIKDRQ